MKIWDQCKACNRTGLNTQGNQCYPCSVHGVEVCPLGCPGDPSIGCDHCFPSKHTKKVEPEDDPAMEGFL